MLHKHFYVFLIAIAVLGIVLRLIDYDKTPPWREVDDEVHYAWAGISLLKTGIPESWSFLSSYSEVRAFTAWNTDWRMVKPMLEKPPLYLFLSGVQMLLAGQNTFESVRLSTIRLLPVSISFFTIALTGLFALVIFNSAPVALLSALLYAVGPTFVLANRLSVTENLLTPLMLLCGILCTKYVAGDRHMGGERVGSRTSLHLSEQREFEASSGKHVRQDPHYLLKLLAIALTAGLAALTKQSGLSVIIAVLFLCASFKKWRELLIVGVIAGALYALYPLWGLLIDKQLFLTLMSEARRIGIQGGLPQVLLTLIGRPLITTEKLFPDGSILFGYILLFSAPLWMKKSDTAVSSRDVSRQGTPTRLQTSLEFNNTKHVFLAFPFAYLLYLTVFLTGAETIGSGQAFWGWYAYPLFPYLAILVAVQLIKLFKQTEFWETGVTILFLGTGMVRFLFLFFERAVWYRWQHAVILLIIGLIATSLLPKLAHKRIVLIGFVLLFVVVNALVSLNTATIYGALQQP